MNKIFHIIECVIMVVSIIGGVGLGVCVILNQMYGNDFETLFMVALYITPLLLLINAYCWWRRLKYDDNIEK